jgi:hypothetical protein
VHRPAAYEPSSAIARCCARCASLSLDLCVRCRAAARRTEGNRN